jgi:hypothetical protein
MEEDEYITLDIIESSVVDNRFPWYELSQAELIQQLELIYKDNSKLPKTFPHSIAKLVIDSQKDTNKLDKIFSRNYVLPVVHEQLVSYDVFSAEKIKKKTFNHREILFVPQNQRHEYVGNVYNQVFSDDTFIVNSYDNREIIDKNDLGTYPVGLQPRMTSKDERLAIVGFILDYNLIANTRFVKFSYSAKDYGTHFLRKMYSHVPWKLYTRSMLDELYNRIQEIDKFIINNRTEYTINVLLKILALPNHDKRMTIKDTFFVEIAKVMKKYYPTISIEESSSYTSADYYHEITNGIDIGRLGRTFVIICSLHNENKKASDILLELESLVNKKQHLQNTKESTAFGGKAFGGKALPLIQSSNNNTLIAKGLLELFKNDLIEYYRIISISQIKKNTKETEDARSLKDQIYRSLILSIYGNTRYNEINILAKQHKNSNFFDLVSDTEKIAIEKKHTEITKHINTIRKTTCGHIHIRREYDLLELNDPKKHLLFLQLRTEYTTSEISSEQRNNKQLICKNDGLIIGCEHEVILAQMNTATVEQKTKYSELLERVFIADDESFDSATCAFCGRKVEDSKVLLMNEFDDLRQPKMFFRLTMSQSHDIESSIIKAIQKNEPLKGVDELQQRMNAIFLWDDVRRIFDYTEASITKYYSVIDAKRDHLEKIYKELSKVCVIYSHITYEIIHFRANSASYLSTADMPWKYDIADLTNPTIIIKRCMTMIRLRFGNLYTSVDKIKKGMFQEYIGKIYMQYTSFRSNNRIVINQGVDRWINVFYKKTMSEIVNDQMILLSKTNDKKFVLMAEESIYKHNMIFSTDVKNFFKESKELVVSTTIPRRNIPLLSGHEFTKVHLIPATFLLIDEPDSVEEIKPVDYNKYGVKQKWTKIILTTNKDTKEYQLSEYNKINSLYNTYFTNSYNAENVLPENYILANNPSVESVDYKNIEDELKSKKKKETYTEEQQEKIRTLIGIQKSVADMYEYQYTTQNIEFGKLLTETVKNDNIKGYVISDYKTLLDKFTSELSLDNARATTSSIIIGKTSESEIPPPNKREKSTGIIYFKEQGNSLILAMVKSLGIQENSVIEHYYEKIQILGRRTIQEAEEMEQYSGISEHLKGLSQQEINELHSGFQIDKIKMYIRIIYQSLSMIHNANESDDTTGMYNTSQGKFLIRYVGKIDIPYSIIKVIGPKIKNAEKQKNKNDELQGLFNTFYETCMSVIKISNIGADLIKDLVDYFLDQDKDVNLSIKFIDYNLHLKEAVAQFRYDKERFKQKQLDAEAPDELMVISEKGEIDVNDDAIVHERDIIPENKKMLIDEYRGAYEDYRQNINRLND